MVAFPERAAPELAVQETVTLPGPLPFAGATESQEPLPVAVQAPPKHPLGNPFRVKSWEPAEGVGEAIDGVSEKFVQATGAPPWFTGKAFPAIVALSDRADPALAVQFTVTFPGPLPVEGETVIQEPFPAVVHDPPTQPVGEPVNVTSWDPAE